MRTDFTKRHYIYCFFGRCAFAHRPEHEVLFQKEKEQQKILPSSYSAHPVWPGGSGTMLKTCDTANFQVQVMKPFNIIEA